MDSARRLYEQYGAPMIDGLFPEYAGRIAAGLAGHGSECFGFEDDISLDHDVDNGFCLWLEDGDYDIIGLALQEEYLKLPFASAAAVSRASRHTGVMRISDFYRQYTGSAGAPVSWRQWFYLPSYALAEAVNGQVWRDDSGHFSAERAAVMNGMPEDVRLKKMAACLFSMAQAGQYNYGRCLAHGEEGAAMMAMSEFVRSASAFTFLYCRIHMPYYKWMFRAMEDLGETGEIRFALEQLLTGPNDAQGQELKKALIEDICADTVRKLLASGLTDGNWDYLEPHAYELMERIRDPEIRSLHVSE